MKTALKLTAAVLAAGSLAIGTAASAVVFTSGSFAISAFTSSNTDVTTTSIFPLTSAVTIGSPVDDFAAVVLPPTITLPAGAVDLNIVGCCNWTDPQLGTFAGTLAPVRTQTTPHPNASATWDVVGQYTVGPAFSNAGAILTANITWSMTQTGGPTAATSISGTFHSPRASPPNGAPEPGTLALLGLGLAGLAATRRRKK